MKKGLAVIGAGAFLAMMVTTGCETGTTAKTLSCTFHLSDVSTSPILHPGSTQKAIGLPPVPGSPVAAGADGYQPANDDEARPSPGSEEGKAMLPRMHLSNGFQRQ